MNSLERIASTIAFKTTDRIPVIAQVFGHAAVQAGIPLNDYLRDGETIARCQLSALKRYGYDAVFSVMDVNVEAEALGSEVRYRENQYPTIERYALSPDRGWALPPFPDPQRAGRMPEMLAALRILRRELGNEVLIVGCVLGPFTLVTQLIGLEKTIYLAIDDPECFERILDFATDVVMSFGIEQLRSGAHLPVVFDPSASPAVIPPQFFREFELPRLTRLFKSLSGSGAIANWLHIAGPVGPIIPLYPEAGVNIANFDYNVSATEMEKNCPTLCFDGNIKSLSFAEDSPEMIRQEALTLLRIFRQRGGFILSSGCEIPPESRPETIEALVNAVRL
ncbi:MAG: uroporphyrinogen decarboxylase family protein [Endomicrobiales bacterium]|jgi:uroporphyrinogen decarboxylase